MLRERGLHSLSSRMAVMRRAWKNPSLHLFLLALLVWGTPSETAKEAIVLSCEGEWNGLGDSRNRVRHRLCQQVSEKT